MLLTLNSCQVLKTIKKLWPLGLNYNQHYSYLKTPIKFKYLLLKITHIFKECCLNINTILKFFHVNIKLHFVHPVESVSETNRIGLQLYALMSDHSLKKYVINLFTYYKWIPNRSAVVLSTNPGWLKLTINHQF